jgi:diguanylate cyclase (GGDEF)-like protein
MTRQAWFYVGLVYLLGGLLFGFSILTFFSYEPVFQQLPTFIIITSLATVTQLFKSEAPSHQVYHPALIFVFAGVLLLDPFYFALLIIISHLAEWIKERLTVKGEHLRAWYIQPFNICMHIILGFSARSVFNLLTSNSASLTATLSIIAVAAAAATYVILNHLMVGLAISLARGVSIKESGILNYENLTTDFVMFVLGYVVAILYQLNSWLIIPTLTPLYLIYRALAVPSLEQKAKTDPKTGLWNAEYFLEALEIELRRANRFKHPLTVVMADLDFLRNINNTYGHLGGDAVLIGIADILKENFREFDIVSRFGGEEFAFLLPETPPEIAYPRIESVRNKIETANFLAPTTEAQIKATMSFGITGKTPAQQTAKEIIHQADVAVYHAKISGRNCTSVYSDEIADTLGIS